MFETLIQIGSNLWSPLNKLINTKPLFITPFVHEKCSRSIVAWALISYNECKFSGKETHAKL